MNVNELKQFKCQKVVRAARIDGYDTTTLAVVVKKAIVEIVVGADWMTRHKPEPGGYFVVHADGYQSYSTPEAFESGYIPFEAIDLSAADFSDALMWLKEGKRVQRAGWNGKNQFVEICKFNGKVFVSDSDKGISYPIVDVLGLKNAHDQFVPGWVPSVGDLMATDWQVFVEPAAEGVAKPDLERSYRTRNADGTDTLHFVSNLMPHQARVIEEYNDLHEKLWKLMDFFGSERVNAVPQEERERMHQQSLYMVSYHSVLLQRIRAF